MMNAKKPLPQGLMGWYKRKMAQANLPRNEAQKRVLDAYSNYLLKDLTATVK